MGSTRINDKATADAAGAPLRIMRVMWRSDYRMAYAGEFFKVGATFTESQEYAYADGGRVVPTMADVLSSSRHDFRNLFITLIQARDAPYSGVPPSAFLDSPRDSLDYKHVMEFAAGLSARIASEVPEIDPNVEVDSAFYHGFGTVSGHLAITHDGKGIQLSLMHLHSLDFHDLQPRQELVSFVLSGKALQTEFSPQANCGGALMSKGRTGWETGLKAAGKIAGYHVASGKELGALFDTDEGFKKRVEVNFDDRPNANNIFWADGRPIYFYSSVDTQKGAPHPAIHYPVDRRLALMVLLPDVARAEDAVLMLGLKRG